MLAYMFGIIPIPALALPSRAATAGSSSVSVRAGSDSWYSLWLMVVSSLGEAPNCGTLTSEPRLL